MESALDQSKKTYFAGRMIYEEPTYKEPPDHVKKTLVMFIDSDGNPKKIYEGFWSNGQFFGKVVSIVQTVPQIANAPQPVLSSPRTLSPASAQPSQPSAAPRIPSPFELDAFDVEAPPMSPSPPPPAQDPVPSAIPIRVPSPFQLNPVDETVSDDLKRQIYEQHAFGKEQWEKYCPGVRFTFGVEGYQSLPNDFVAKLTPEILNSHMLIRMPEKVDGDTFEYHHINEMIKKVFPNLRQNYIKSNQPILSYARSKWLLIPIEPHQIDQDVGMVYKFYTCINNLLRQTKIKFETPNPIELATAAFVHLVKTKRNLFPDESWYSYCLNTDEPNSVYIFGNMTTSSEGPKGCELKKYNASVSKRVGNKRIGISAAALIND